MNNDIIWNKEINPGIYRHFKGNIYKVIGVSKHSETLEDLVIYQDLNNSEKLWARPVSKWNEPVFIDGKETVRFEYIGENEENLL